MSWVSSDLHKSGGNGVYNVKLSGEIRLLSAVTTDVRGEEEGFRREGGGGFHGGGGADPTRGRPTVEGPCY